MDVLPAGSAKLVVCVDMGVPATLGVCGIALLCGVDGDVMNPVLLMLRDGVLGGLPMLSLSIVVVWLLWRLYCFLCCCCDLPRARFVSSFECCAML